jgi:2-polyprenyl-3-methyl-5-hydroxy-6-metoxy-1,4-benzoquinol methylase
MAATIQAQQALARCVKPAKSLAHYWTRIQITSIRGAVMTSSKQALSPQSDDEQAVHTAEVHDLAAARAAAPQVVETSTWRRLSNCPNCRSGAFETWSAQLESGGLHFSQCLCKACGVVFANPQASEETLRAFYEEAYYESAASVELDQSPEDAAKEVDLQRPEIERVKKYASGGRLLEVGSGRGHLLAAARDAGFEPWGVEPSVAGVANSKALFDLEHVSCGLLSDTAYEDASFDVVFAWHVIEHVLDLDEFVGEIHRILKPGGVVWIGTETYRNAGHYAYRLARTLRGRPAPFATSNEHTFVFTTKTLADVLDRRGFRTEECTAYQLTWREKMETMRFRSPVGAAWYAALHAINLVFRTGPLLRLGARRV